MVHLIGFCPGSYREVSPRSTLLLHTSADSYMLGRNQIAVGYRIRFILHIMLILSLGLLITFTQFLLTLLFAWPHQFSRENAPFFLKRNAIPIRRWLLNIVLFFSVNILNNLAFGYKISVPVHIILRSGGSVTTILVGWLWGKRFTRLQIISVAFLTIGVIIAAMADAQAQVSSRLKTCSVPVSPVAL